MLKLNRPKYRVDLGQCGRVGELDDVIAGGAAARYRGYTRSPGETGVETEDVTRYPVIKVNGDGTRAENGAVERVGGRKVDVTYADIGQQCLSGCTNSCRGRLGDRPGKSGGSNSRRIIHSGDDDLHGNRVNGHPRAAGVCGGVVELRCSGYGEQRRFSNRRVEGSSFHRVHTQRRSQRGGTVGVGIGVLNKFYLRGCRE